MNKFKYRAIRYLWDPEPRNEDPSSTIWCLGQQYNTKLPQNEESNPGNTSDPSSPWPPEFLDDFESRIWMTYRTDFIPIPRSLGNNKGLPFTSPAAALQYAGKLLSGQGGEGFSSDVGWGCMIRSAQSVLANALITLHLGRGGIPFELAVDILEWRINGTELNMKHVEILSWFADDPPAPFSIHKFVKHGEVSCAKSPGEWFGPAAASRCIQ
jgi:cysteine protease ATG4